MAAKNPKKSTGKAATKAAKKTAPRKAVKAASAGSNKKASAKVAQKPAKPGARPKSPTKPKKKAAKSAPTPRGQTRTPRAKAATSPATPVKPTSTRTTTPKGQVIKKKSVIKRPISVSAHPSDSPFKNFTPYEPKRGEPYMTTDQLEHFRMILLRWRQELMEEVDRTVHHMQDEAANFPDPADRATQEEEFSIELRTRDRERKLIKKIDQTIDRIDQEDYGYCDTCGIEIGLRRLEARPTASQCVDCKTLDEIKERQQHGG